MRGRVWYIHLHLAFCRFMLEGVPMFSTHEACFSHQWSAGKLSDIEDPCLNDRENYITHYTINSHWNLDEIKKGIFWEKYD